MGTIPLPDKASPHDTIITYVADNDNARRTPARSAPYGLLDKNLKFRYNLGRTGLELLQEEAECQN